MKKSNGNRLTEKQKEALAKMNEVGCTDSDVYDFCVKNKVSQREAAYFMAELNAPEPCKGCKHVVMRNFYPCDQCSRLQKKDMYEKRNSQEG